MKISATSVVNFKDTPLGPLPEEWQVVRLGEVAEMKQGKVLPTNRFTERGYPVFGANGQIGWYTEFTHEDSEVLVTCRGATCGRINMTPPRSFVTNNAMVLTPKTASLLKPYLAYSLMYFSVETAVTGTGQPQITKATLSYCCIPLPPLPEQRAIAHVLRTVQEAKQASKRVVAALRELKRSLMRHLFTYGPLPVGAKDFFPQRETEIGPIPAHWQVVRLGEVVEVKGGKRLPKGDSFSKKPTSYPYIRVTDFRNGSVDKSNLKFLTPEQHHLLFRYVINRQDVYISIAGTIGLVGCVPDELDGAHLTENAARLILKNNRIHQSFLVFALATDRIQQEIQGRATKTSQPKLALARIKEIPIPLPPLAEQREIARILQTVDRRIQAEEAYARALSDLFQSLLHELISGQRRVEFTTENTEHTEKK